MKKKKKFTVQDRLDEITITKLLKLKQQLEKGVA